MIIIHLIYIRETFFIILFQVNLYGSRDMFSLLKTMFAYKSMKWLHQLLKKQTSVCCFISLTRAKNLATPACLSLPTDSGLFGTLESKKNRKLGKLAYWFLYIQLLYYCISF